MPAHALLSASGAKRWIACPPSARLEERLKGVFGEQSSPFALEGTIAHALSELKLLREKGKLGDPDGINEFNFNERVKVLNNGSIPPEMDVATDFYVDTIMEKYMLARRLCPDAKLLIEQRLDFSEWVPHGFGTGDAIIVSDVLLEVIDLKYGKGVRVNAVGNPQARCYGLGALAEYDELYDIKEVHTVIIQPRLDHVSTEEMGIVELYSWAAMVVKPAAAAALDRTAAAPTACGEWCRWCPAKATCRTRAEAMLELAKYDFQKPPLLQPDEIGDILRKAEELYKWVADVQGYALEQALAGEHYDGWKLVEGRSVRKYADDVKVAEKLNAAGWEDALIYERKLLGLTNMEKLVGKKKLAETLGDLIVKPAGKPVLVQASDKRPEINAAESAKTDFAEAADG